MGVYRTDFYLGERVWAVAHDGELLTGLVFQGEGYAGCHLAKCDGTEIIVPLDRIIREEDALSNSVSDEIRAKHAELAELIVLPSVRAHREYVRSLPCVENIKATHIALVSTPPDPNCSIGFVPDQGVTPEPAPALLSVRSSTGGVAVAADGKMSVSVGFVDAAPEPAPDICRDVLNFVGHVAEGTSLDVYGRTLGLTRRRLSDDDYDYESDDEYRKRVLAAIPGEDAPELVRDNPDKMVPIGVNVSTDLRPADPSILSSSEVYLTYGGKIPGAGPLCPDHPFATVTNGEELYWCGECAWEFNREDRARAPLAEVGLSPALFDAPIGTEDVDGEQEKTAAASYFADWKTDDLAVLSQEEIGELLGVKMRKFALFAEDGRRMRVLDAPGGEVIGSCAFCLDLQASAVRVLLQSKEGEHFTLLLCVSRFLGSHGELLGEYDSDGYLGSSVCERFIVAPADIAMRLPGWEPAERRPIIDLGHFVG